MAISKAELKKLRLLKTKKGRSEQNSFLVGGTRVLEEAHKFNFLPLKVLFSPEQLSERGLALVGQFKSANVEVSRVSQSDLQSLSDTETSQGILGVFRTAETNLSKLYKPSIRKVLLCDRISDPGNLGTLIRTALAFGFEMIMVTDYSVEIYNPKVVRSSAGAVFGISAANISFTELSEFKKSNKARLLAAVSPGSKSDNINESSLLKLQNDEVLILAIGSEAEGLSKEVHSQADMKVTIEHNSEVESLNAAVAGAILMNKVYQNAQKA